MRTNTMEVRCIDSKAVSYTHLRAHETVLDLVCRLLLEKKTHTQHTQHTQQTTEDNKPIDTHIALNRRIIVK